MPLSVIWELLSQVKTLKLSAVSLQPEWKGKADGVVNLSKIDRDILIFSESGEWNFEAKPRIKFFNVYRWRLTSEETLELSHLRNGMDSPPVHLLDFKKAGAATWHSEKPHLCREDIYSAVLSFEKNSILLSWTIEGPAKRQAVECLYR